MRTIPERRHLDTVAVQRQLKIAGTLSVSNDPHHSQVKREPHRLFKVHMSNVQEGGRRSSNPRRWGVNEKDKLTHAELEANQRFKLIETQDLLDQALVGSNDNGHDAQEIPQSSRLLLA